MGRQLKREYSDGEGATMVTRLFTLSSNEIDVIAESPEALTALIDYNEQQEAYADAMNYVKSAQFHKDRAAELRRLRMEAETKRAERVQ